jgi:hypothetical protein
MDPCHAQASGALLVPLLHYDLTMEACEEMDRTHHSSMVDSTTHSSGSNSSRTLPYFRNQGLLGKNTMDLIRNPSTTFCSLGMGVESVTPVASSSSSSSSSKFLYGSEPLGNILTSWEEAENDILDYPRSGLTMSMWIKFQNLPDNDETSRNATTMIRHIVTLGSDSGSSSSTWRNDNNVEHDIMSICEQSVIDFQLSMVGQNQLEMIYRTSDQHFQPCQRLLLDIPQQMTSWSNSSSRLAHLSISLGHKHQEVLFNGQSLALVREPFDDKLHHWSTSSILQFFSYPYVLSNREVNQSLPWNGQVFQFSFYGNVLDERQVKMIISEGLPPSQPFAIPREAEIYEDARDEYGTLQEIDMSIAYLDREIDNLLTLIGVPHQPPAKVFFYITRFPSRGSIIYPGGNRTIEPDESYPVLVEDVESLVFLPLHNDHSDFPGVAYSSFDYCVTTNHNSILASSQCTSATISVIVNPVNDAPEAIPAGPFFIHEGIQEEDQAIKLTGFDVDEGDYVQVIEITSPPSLGYLYLSVATFREDGLLHGTLLSDINYTISGKEAYIEYRFTDYDKKAVQGSSVVDFFRFRVQDKMGSWSNEEEVEIRVLANIFSFAVESTLSTSDSEDETANLVLAWSDKSGWNRTIGAFIESPPINGTMFDETNRAVREHTIVMSRDGVSREGSINLTYIVTPGKCRHGDALYIRDSFSFRIVSLNTDGQIMSVSTRTIGSINVPCAVEPLIVSVDNEFLSVAAFSTHFDNPCSGYKFDFTDKAKRECSNIVAMPEIHVHNSQRQAENVFVSISTMHGLLSLNQGMLGDIESLSDQTQMRPKIRLLSPPGKVQDILSTIHFQSDVIGTDEIRLVLQSGKCNHEKGYLIEHNFSDSGAKCYKTERAIVVDVMSNHSGPEGFIRREFPWIPLPFTFCMLLFLKLRGKSREILRRRDKSGDLNEEKTCDLTSLQSDVVRWKQHYDAETGFFYYQNVEDGEITWDPPLDERFEPASNVDQKVDGKLVASTQIAIE